MQTLRFLVLTLLSFFLFIHSTNRQDTVYHYKIWGIDISKYQRNINWDKVAKTKPSFVFIKATEGIWIKDEYYLKNKKASEKRGLLTGAYHLLGYRTPARDQAKEFIHFAKLHKGNLIPVLDVEQRPRMPGKSKVLYEIRQYIKVIKQHYGVAPIIYTNTSYYNRYLKNEGFDKYTLWIADYRYQPNCKWDIWQHTEKHRLSGIPTLVDRNVFKGTKTELNKLILK